MGSRSHAAGAEMRQSRFKIVNAAAAKYAYTFKKLSDKDRLSLDEQRRIEFAFYRGANWERRRWLKTRVNEVTPEICAKAVNDLAAAIKSAGRGKIP